MALESNPYDEVPYPRLAFPHTLPEHLGAIALVQGLPSPPAERCRVLEIGCARGSNLLPMAYGRPNSEFVGIDRSRRQIAEAREVAAALGLKNIRFDVADIMELGEPLGEFDYIIAHGIYSWVPAEVRDRLLQVCRDRLTPTGVAYVSYNALPGGHLHRMVRQMCLYAGRNQRDPLKLAAETRKFLQFLVESLPAGNDPYGGVLRAVLQYQTDLLCNDLDGVLLHDALEADNHPVYLHQFVAAAAGHGLQYLGDCFFDQMCGAGIAREAREKLRDCGDPVEYEQYLDFLYGRSFRGTLLCRRETSLDRAATTDAVAQLWIRSEALPVDSAGERIAWEALDLGSTTPVCFKTLTTSVDVTKPLGKAALAALAQNRPAAMRAGELAQAVAALGQRSSENQPGSPERLMELAFGWYSLGLVELLTQPPRCVTVAGQRPVASGLARYEAARGWEITNLLHRHIPLPDPLARQVLALLDGSRDRASLVEVLAEPVLQGKVPLRVAGAAIDDPALVRQTLGGHLDLMLRSFAKNALLEA